MFQYAGARAVGDVFDPDRALAFCVNPHGPMFDADGGGVIFACVILRTSYNLRDRRARVDYAQPSFGGLFNDSLGLVRIAGRR